MLWGWQVDSPAAADTGGGGAAAPAAAATAAAAAAAARPALLTLHRSELLQARVPDPHGPDHDRVLSEPRLLLRGFTRLHNYIENPAANSLLKIPCC